MAQNYLGISPYDENSEFRFVGRSEETWMLYDRIARNDYTVYYAATGEGKSSLIKAGLIPILRRRDIFPVYIVFKDDELDLSVSYESIIEERIRAEEAKGNVRYEQSSSSKSLFTPEQSQELEKHFWWKVRNYCFKNGERELIPLFIFDQFEEVFTKASYEWTDSFFAWLELISTDYIPAQVSEVTRDFGCDIPTQKNFKALFSFRTEYLGDLDYWCVQKHFLPSLQDNRMCLKALTPEGAHEVISLDDALLKHSDRIIKGCAEKDANISNKTQPCVYALILSVVCQTLSDLPESKREQLLNDLGIRQDETIDKILLTFYKDRLRKAGLDYDKAEGIVSKLEVALVDENGKRRRRDTNEDSMRSLERLISKLSSKDNGLVKIVGRKKKENETIYTVEFPHDRLCKAINTAKQERQDKIIWRLKRQREWMQFGIISAIMVLIAFLWKSLMPAIKSVVHGALSKTDVTFNEFTKNYLNGRPSYIYENFSLDEGFSTILLMALLAVFVPFLTMSCVRKKKKWILNTLVVSSISAICSFLLVLRNANIGFTHGFTKPLTIAAFVFSAVLVILSVIKLKNEKNNVYAGTSDDDTLSWWPFWGAFFLFALFVFHEFQTNTTFGISEPCDSSWALVVIPSFYALWAKGFFCMKSKQEDFVWKDNTLMALGMLFLLLIAIISYLPPYTSFKQSFGMPVSLLLIAITVIFATIGVKNTVSVSQQYSLSQAKRWTVISGGAIVLFAVYFLNLGYNPLCIKPGTVCYVASWRTVVIQDTRGGDKKLGVLFALNGDTIVPCHILLDERADSLLLHGETPYKNGKGALTVKHFGNPFSDSITYNPDKSLVWNANDSTLTARIPTTPTLEEYLHKVLRRGLPKSSGLQDSIDYHAATLFTEIRRANIEYAMYSRSYGEEALPTLPVLDSLQHIALDKQLARFVVLKEEGPFFPIDSTYNPVRRRIDVLEDSHLVDFHQDLSRSFLLCMIRDRLNRNDMPALFSLLNIYLIAYFTDVPSMNISLGINTKIVESNRERTDNISVYSSDISDRRPFAWYDLFNGLCNMDIGWNQKVLLSLWNDLRDIIENYSNFMQDLSEDLMNENSKTSYDLAKNAMDSLKVLLNVVNLKKELKSKSDYYTEAISNLENMDATIKYVITDEALRQIKQKVLDCLITIMREKPYGIYNNELENICEKLITVSFIRGNDIVNDTTELYKYHAERIPFFEKQQSLADAVDNFRKKKETVVQEMKKLVKLINN